MTAWMLLNYKGLKYRTEWVSFSIPTLHPLFLGHALTTPIQLKYPEIRPRLSPQFVPPHPFIHLPLTNH